MEQPPTRLRDLIAQQSSAPLDFEGLQARIANEQPTLATQSTSRRRGFLIAASLGMLLGVALIVGRADLAVYPMARLVAEIAVLGAVGLGLFWALLRPAFRPLGAPRTVALAAAGLALLGLVLPMLPVAHVAHEASLAGAGADLVDRAVRCLLFGSAIAVPLGALALRLHRGERPPGTAALMAGAAGGLLGVAALALHCPLTAPVHLFWGHAVVPLLVTVPLVVAAVAIGRSRRPIR